MTVRALWKKDWMVGLVLCVAALVASQFESDTMASLEGRAYDAAAMRTERTPSDRIAIIAIDDASIANIGRWPWSRDVHAKLIDTLADTKPKVIAHLAFFSEDERDRGLPFIERIAKAHDAATQALSGADQTTAASLNAPLTTIGAILNEAKEALDADRKLASSFTKAGNVVLPMLFRLDRFQPAGAPDKTLPAFVTGSTVKPVGGIPDQNDVPLPAVEVVSMPIDRLGAALSGVGHLHSNADKDGVYRADPLVVDYSGYLVPSLATTIAAKALNVAPKDIQVQYGQGLKFGNVSIETGSHMSMRTQFYRNAGERSAFPVDSFYDVYSGKLKADKYRDKIVLIGPTAAGVASMLPSPVDPVTAPVTMLAHNVSSILQRHFIVAPWWGPAATIGAILLVGLYLTLLLPRLHAKPAAAVSAVLLLVLLVTPYLSLTQSSTWLKLMLPAVLLVVGHLMLTTKQYLLTEAGKAKSDAESAESNRMLGLAFQGQGQLDMAFDKFRRIPMSDSLMDILHGLALDFERKRQFNKAESVFRYMADFNPDYRDLKERLARAKQLSETVILGGAKTSSASTIIAGAGIEKPMLGRYQVEKELGRGAMGTVYLGKDPKIGRMVAIKTMALGQEFEGEELQEARERFFREAETAGRLNHPNIVTIFDAGEEHDLAYIAMEFLKGKDLTGRSKVDQLLVFERVVSICARVAEALDYAHKNNVVHRDIKPANIMYEDASDTVKVTDFGIARITDSSKTKTGLVLGTPSYMSPEQLAGQRIDGRSDLYSLGVTLYVLACGQLPFQGDSMAALMYRIANDPTPDIRKINTKLPGTIVAFLNKAMAKDPAQRFQNGQQFAHALRIIGGAYRNAAQPSAQPASATTAEG